MPPSIGGGDNCPGVANVDQSDGDADGHYTNAFGGTSSACPGAAGVAALVIARNPELRWDQVKALLKQGCERIDPSGGHYDASGHSKLYGYGRLNAKAAVELAAPTPVAGYTAVHKAIQSVPIADLKTARLRVAVGDTRSLRGLKVSVDLEHTWIGDLTVKLKPPAGLDSGALVLHDREGGGTRNIHRVYDVASTPALAMLDGAVPTGVWTLEVRDHAERDVGHIRSFGLELQL